MSAHRLILVAKAERDLQNILRSTNRRWGPEQRVRYKRRLTEAMDRLTRFPELGPLTDQHRPGLRASQTGQHVIYYVVDADLMTVVRILHVRMDPATQFGEQAT